MPEETPPLTSWVFIPYDYRTGPGAPPEYDVGTRPLPGQKTIYYQCPSIRINGAAYDGTELQPGPLSLSLALANEGGRGEWVTARFYLSDPATGLDPTCLVGSAPPLWVPADTHANGKHPLSAPITVTLPAEKPHLCIFAEAWISTDPPEFFGNAVKDRHWAQQNLQIRAANPGQNLTFPFMAVGSNEDALHTVHIRLDGPREGQGVISLESGDFRIVDTVGGASAEQELQIDLKAFERRPMEVTLRIPEDAPAGAKSAFVIEQTPAGTESPTGAIGINVVVPA